MAIIKTKERIIMGKRPTLQMVAEIAGVSRGTVDRVLHNRSYVNPDVRARVLEAIQETGYLAPRQAHQSVVADNTFSTLKLGVLLPNWTGHFKNEILRGVDAARKDLEDFQVQIIVEECKTDIPEETIELLDNLIAQNVHGIALCSIDDPSIEKKVSSLVEQNIPVITFNSDLPDSNRLCFVGQNYEQSGRIAAELMSKCIPTTGKILAVVGNLEFDGHKKRLKGFCQHMYGLGFDKSQINIIETYNDYQTTYRKVLESLEQIPDLCAIYMANRSVAGCTEAVSTAGRKGSLRIICHDVSESTKRLLQNGSIDFTISQNIFHQGYLPLIYLREFLQKGILPQSDQTDTNISIICSQNIDNTIK